MRAGQVLRGAIALAALLFATGPLSAQVELREADRDRLADFDRIAGRALLRALQEGAAADVNALVQALTGAAAPPAPNGDWSCRTMKLGGLNALVVYTNFRCRITATGPTSWRFEKLTGSQRTIGMIFLSDGRFVYAGAGHVGEAPAMPYAELPPAQTPVEPNQTVPDVAIFEQVSDSRARLLFPAPLLESDFDILELTR